MDNNNNTCESNPPSLIELDTHIIALVLSFLDIQGKLWLGATCKKVLEISKQSDLWRQICGERWSSLKIHEYDGRSFFLAHCYIPSHVKPELLSYLLPNADEADKKSRWSSIFSNWDYYISSGRKELREAVAKGIPKCQRKFFWRLALKHNSTLNFEYSFETLTQHHDKFAIIDRPSITKRYNFDAFYPLVEAYHAFDPSGEDVRFGITYIVLVLFKYFSASEAFSFLVHTMQEKKYNLRSLLYESSEKTIENFSTHVNKLKILHEYYFPDFPFVEFQYTPYIAATVVNAQTSLADRFWDLFLLEGYDIVYFFCLAIVHVVKELPTEQASENVSVSYATLLPSDGPLLQPVLEKIVNLTYYYLENTPAHLFPKQVVNSSD